MGEAVSKCGVSREELFLTTKIWISNGGYEKAKDSIDESLQKLKTDYVDLMLIHQPFNDYYGSYRAMEEAYKAGKIRAIGVSNFMPDRFIDIAGFVETIPAVNQLEVHVFQQQKAAREILKKHGTQLMAWSPLAQGKNNLFANETLTEIGENYGKTAAQVNLRFLIQTGVVVIPKSIHRERMEENFNLFDFSLTEGEMHRLEALDLGHSQFIDHYAPEVAQMFVDAGKM
ncbi:putative oxidoreductase/MSMEI_2347 [Lachnospiraceae bacterium]|nr:putative oxidoreductase/MSMEI_2347 [Lachnospiraceae bacterium]